VTTPMGTATVFDPDENGEAIDQRVYRSLIVSLLYIMVTQSDIPFVMCLCAHFEASPHPSHRQAVQQIFRYLKYTLEFGIWFSSSSSLDLVGFFYADFAGYGIDQKNTSSTCNFLGCSLICWSSHKQSFVA
jgi:hypothetical protein